MKDNRNNTSKIRVKKKVMRLLTTLLKVFSKTICNQTVPEDGSEYF